MSIVKYGLVVVALSIASLVAWRFVCGGPKVANSVSPANSFAALEEAILRSQLSDEAKMAVLLQAQAEAGR